jgi:DNA-binding response OmpR family regulator
MPGVFLIGKEWTTRALLRAQLLEEKVDVEAFETVGEAKQILDADRPSPSLIVADLSSSLDPDGDAESLARLACAIPIWIIAGKTVIVSKNFGECGFERVLLKPLDAGELVEQIKRRLVRGWTWPAKGLI